MNIKQSFDISIRDKFLHGEECLPGIKSTDISEFGRLVNGKIRETYFTDDFGKILLSSMPTDVVDAYKNGKGNEFDNGKFFSVASSSRFAVASFTENRDKQLHNIQMFEEEPIQKIQFEYPLRINRILGTPPQMDVYIKTSKETFVEVKCHEIFDESSHSIIKLSSQYINNSLFKEILEHYKINTADRACEFDSEGNCVKLQLTRNHFNVLSKTTRFDLKQFLCHLMGIVSNTSLDENKQFIYLFYKNTNVEFYSVYAELEEEIELIKTSFKWLFDKYNITFRVMYNTKFDTLQ